MDTSLASLSALTQVPVTSETAISIAPGSVVGDVSTATSISLRTTAGAPQELVITVPALGISTRFTASEFTSETWRTGSPYLTSSASHAASNGTVEIQLFHPAAGSIEYHTLGAWGFAPNASSTATLGMFVAGSLTVGSDIPTTGTATYSGLLEGNRIASNVFDTVDALATAQANFASRTVTLTTTGTRSTDLLTTNAVPVAAAGLDITSGSLTYQPGVNALTGTLTTANGMTGNATATFFGPQAAELGGTFKLRDGGQTTTFIGGFSLKR
ncbi:MAG: transferrin-binding protein-like solute binding protein [Burkholderiales bacterium]